MDGKLLALAREEKEDIRRQALRTDRQRHREVYARVPEVRRLDEAIAALVPQAAAAALAGGASPEELSQKSLELQARRAELLAANGWPTDYLDGAWDCPLCRDTGYVRGEMCSCLHKLYDQVQARDLSALLKLGSESFDTFDLSWYDDGRPNGPRAQMQIVFDICRDYALNFRQKGSDNLLLQGSTGLGKTFLSACIAREVARQGRSVVYETAGGAMDAYEAARFGRDEDAAAHTRRMEGCDLLILDDLGTEMVSAYSVTALYTLINTRLMARKKTVVTTNLTDEQIKKRYTPQIASRLLGEYQDLHFIGADIRALKKARSLD